MCVCMYVCMKNIDTGCTQTTLRIYVCMYVCGYVCVCMCVCIYVYMYLMYLGVEPLELDLPEFNESQYFD